MEDANAPAGESSVPEGSGTPPAAEGTPVASAGVGNAPDVGGDAQVGDGAAEVTPAQTPAEFLFANRKFRDQKHAEEILGSEIGRTRGLQKQNADLQKQLEQLQGVVAALQGQAPKGNGKGQVQPEKKGSFAEKLAKDGDLQFYVDRALTKDAQGNVQVSREGLMEAFFAMAHDMDKHHQETLEQAMNEVRTGTTSLETRIQTERTMARAFTAAKDLASEFPELADDNRAEGIEDVQADIIDLLKSGPPVMLENGNVVPMRLAWLATEPKEAMRWAAETYRRQHGIPVFAQPPGTSESPSAKAAAAAESAAARTAATPLDGSGVPRQGSKESSSLEQRWRTESAQLPKEARSPSGRPLGFPEPA